MAINVRKVVLGGLAAAVVMIVINVVSQFALMDRVRREMNAFAPGTADRMSMGPGTIVTRVIMTVIFGIMLVWFYAAIRPRFGPGARTASYAAIFIWILGGLFYSDYLFMGMMSVATWSLFAIIQLVNIWIATWVGARIYTEGPAATG
jgi:hypothetical protein